uniref:Glycosyl hydrolase family 38 C-terminal domain-containing protein n=1 Tax=Arion vulgaris TaxID=1028688 RepID=A0A0B7AS40_9EUPU
MTNGQLRAVIDSLGRLVSLTCYDKRTNSWSKEAIDSHQPANQFLLYDDVPLYWDAWDVMDYHLETRKPVMTALQRTMVVDDIGSARVILEFSLKISDQSYLKQQIFLDASSPYIGFHTEVSWFENRKFLKVEFPTTVHTTQATYNIQSGFIHRPNHYNTSWDSARYEVCGHKWADLSEHNFGVALINNCKYGHSAVDGILRLSLLRAPKTPDPKADMGVHTFSYAIMPHTGSFQEADVIHMAESFNCPLRTVSANPADLTKRGVDRGLFVLDTKQVLLQALKMAEDHSRTIILRLHEAYGGSTKVKITTRLPLQDVYVCNGLEEQLHDVDRDVQVQFVHEENQCHFEFSVTAFQIVSLRCLL